jgi:hypothetical protein
MSDTTHTEERISILIKELAKKRRATNWGTNLSLIVGLLAIGALCVYFGYGYFALDEITRPEKVVDFAKSKLVDLSKDGRRIAADEVKKSAPIWAQEASRELVANMPSFRTKAETTIVEYLDEQLEKTHATTEQEFVKLMEENRADFKDAIDVIVKDGGSDEFMDKIMPIIEREYAPDMKDSVSNALSAIQELNRRIEKLSMGLELNPIEEQQKHILGLTRLLRSEQ